MKTLAVSTSLLAALVCLAPGAAPAQTYPNKPGEMGQGREGDGLAAVIDGLESDRIAATPSDRRELLASTVKPVSAVAVKLLVDHSRRG